MATPATPLQPGLDPRHKPGAVAVVGLACVFPGAVGPAAFWSLLTEGRCAVSPVPAERWDAGWLPAWVAPAASFIADADCFDAAFFGISPKEAAALDPRQRLALQVAWWALEHAGIAPDTLKEKALGVFVGAVNGEYAGGFRSPEAIEPHLGVGLSNAVIANRISHVLGTRGPSMAIDTACSSSLVAVHLACRSLQSGDCTLALAGGVGLMLRPDSMVGLGVANMTSPDGLCKSFDAAADGYGRGEGCGLVVLKRLEDALAGGDTIHAVIRGSATNHDGLSNGITAPNGLSQESLIRAALQDAGLTGADIQYAEAHGTGTLLGDPTEARALGHTLGQQPGRTAPLLIGSVKTNIGHLEAAAGVAGLIKLVLAVQHGQVPASLHYRQGNPHINFEALGLAVAHTRQDWPAAAAGGLRRGAVSSFGFGGANCQVIVEQASPAMPTSATAANAKTPSTTGEATPAPATGQPQLLLLSAASGTALQQLAAQAANQLRPTAAADWPAIAALSQTGRSHLRHRLAVVASDPASAAQLLANLAGGHPAPDALTGLAARRAPNIAFLCPGQGSQRPGMAKSLLDTDADFQATLAEADAALGWSLTSLLRSDSPDIDLTACTQPALLAVGAALARRLARQGVLPRLLAGHSLGEYTAAVIAGGVAYADALRLVAARGRLMQALSAGVADTACAEATPGTIGAMAAVFASEQQVMPLLRGQVSLAAINGEASLTLSGARPDLLATVAVLEAAGIRTRLLRVSTAFHSALLEPMLDEFTALAAAVPWQPLQIPVVSNLTGEVLPVGHVYGAAYWARHTREAVRFADGIRALKAAGIDTALELGAAPTLCGLVQDIDASVRCISTLLPDTGDETSLLRALAALHVQGARLSWAAGRQPAAPGHRLPSYPFAKDRYPLRVGEPGLLASQGNATPPPALAGPAAAATAEPPGLAEPNATPQTTTNQAPPDRSAIHARVVTLVARLLGVERTQVDTAAPFLELGADSLILIQAVGQIEAEFGTRVSVRALFDNVSTIDALADHLAERLGTGSVQAPASVVASAAPLPQAATPALHPAATATATASVRKPPPQAATSSLNDTQRAHLATLSSAYTARTRRSKDYAQRFRPVLADSRGSAGFRFSVKEMLYPIVGQRGDGARIWDLDGNEYIDISMGFGVQLFGHEPAFLREALAESLARGVRIGPQSDAAGEVAELITRITGVERVAFCNTGTEAVMTALRLARTATGRQRVALFRNSYHGHFDGVLGNTLGDTQGDPWATVPRVPGVPPGMVADLALFDYGSADSLALLQNRIHEFAAVLVEPVQSRNPALQPAGFLQALRAMTQAAGTVLIFDEVLTGFRIHPGGAQAHFGVRADLVTYGKVVGGGLPVGVVGGRADILAGIDGGVWQYGDASFPSAETTFFAGTFNKHPLVMAAARAVLTEIERGGQPVYDALNARTETLVAQLDQTLAAQGAPIRMARFGSLFRFVFKQNLDPFFYHLLHRGLYVWEGRNLFLSTAHTDADVAQIVARVSDSVGALLDGGFISPITEPLLHPSPPVAPNAGDAATGPAPTSLELPLWRAQRQLAMLAALSEPGCAAYAMPVALELAGVLDLPRLTRTLHSVATRHDALRASLDLEAGVQRVAPQRDVTLRQHTATAETLDGQLLQSLSQPFDLAQAPAWRADLFTLAADQSVLLVTAHHALVDGLSLQILLDEVARLYSGHSLPPAPSYPALAARMVAAGSRPGDDEHRAFWHQRLQQAPVGIELPFARIRPPLRRFAGARVVRSLGLEALRGLGNMAEKLGLSLSMALLAAFAATLRRAGAQRDMVLGMPYAGRSAGFERSVAYCAHLLPLRLKLQATASVAEVMLAVRHAFLDAIDHASYPMAHILDDLDLPRDPARPPLVNITFNTDRVAALPVLDGVVARPRGVPIAFSRFDLGCNVVDWQDGASIEIDYDSDLFAPADMASFIDAFAAMIGRFGGDSRAPFDDRSVLRAAWLPPASPHPHRAGLLARFKTAAASTPLEAAVQLDNEPALTRQALDTWSDQIAEGLRQAHLGDGPVALALGRTPALPAAMLAAWKLGRAYLPLDPDLPAGRIAELLKLAAPGCLLLEPGASADAADAADAAKAADAAGLVNAAASAGIPLAWLPPAPTHRPAPRPWSEPAPEAPAYLLFTSGSTGRPKLVAVPHGAVLAYLDGIVDALGLVPGLRYAVVSTFAADLGLTAVLPALFHQGCLVIASTAVARDADAFAAMASQARVDLLKIVPSHLEALLAAATPGQVLPRSHLVLGGETARPSLLARLAATGAACRVFNHCGPTEATVGVMLGEWDRHSPAIHFTRPIGQARIALLDAEGQLCSSGETGEIHIGGPALADGYVGQPVLTGQSFVKLDLGHGEERLYRSGDLGRMDGSGAISLLGRKDEQLKIRGYRIEPAEIVAALTREPAISAAIVVPREADSGRLTLLAYVVLAAGHTTLDTEGLLARLKQTLPDAMVPGAIVTLPAFPVTANGKLDLAALPQPGMVAVVAEATPQVEAGLLSRVQALWRELLGNAAISAHDNFFQQGGDSILAIQLIARLHQAGWRARAADLYSFPTLAAFAARIQPATGDTASAAEGNCPLLPSQLRLLERHGDLPAHYNLSVRLKLAAWASPEMVEQALLHLVQQHDALRLRFARGDAGWRAHFAAPVAPRVTLMAPPDGAAEAALLHTLQASLDPAEGRLLAAGWLPHSAGADLVLAVHHLVCDGVSLHLLLEDLRQALLDQQAGHAPRFSPRTTSVKTWAEHLQRLARQDSLVAEAEYWDVTSSLPPPELPGLIATMATMPTTPAPPHAEHGSLADEAQETVALTADATTQLLRRRPGGTATTEDAVIAALTLALSPWSGEPLAYLELEGHGRETGRGTSGSSEANGSGSGADLSRTVGWFTSRFPAWFDLSGVALCDAAEAIAEQRQAIPGRGLGYGPLRYLGPDKLRAQLAAGELPGISVNYLGQTHAPPADAFSVTSWSPERRDRGPERAPTLPRQHAIALEVFVLDGCLQAVWQFNPARHRAADIRQAARHFIEHLQTLAAPQAATATQEAEPCP